MARFVILRPDKGEPTPDRSLQDTMAAVRQRAKKYRPLYVVMNKGLPETKRTFARRKAALRNTKTRLPKLPVGGELILRSRTGESRIRRVEPPSVDLPESLKPSYVPQIQRDIYVFIMANFPGVRWAGTCYCRDNRQGTGLSDHACCGAGDFFPVNKAQGDAIKQAVMREFGDRIEYIAWQVALHFDHLHIATCRCFHCFPGGCI
jgi:hypothetical protein